MIVYKLTHRRHIEYKLHTGEWITDNRVIGFFSSRENADTSAESLRVKPGFCDYPEDFTVDSYELSAEKTEVVYLAEHSYYLIEERIDNIVEIGVFSTEDEAMAAVAEYERYATYPVRTHLWDEDFDIDNFLSVAKYELDVADFAEGFELN